MKKPVVKSKKAIATPLDRFYRIKGARIERLSPSTFRAEIPVTKGSRAVMSTQANSRGGAAKMLLSVRDFVAEQVKYGGAPGAVR